MLNEITEVTCAIIRRESLFLAVKRSNNMPHPGKWEFPGGKLKTGESPEKCIRREISEELGVTVLVDSLLPSVLHSYSNGAIRLIPFICSIEEDEIRLTEHSACKWYTLDELAELDLLEADRRILPLLKAIEMSE